MEAGKLLMHVRNAAFATRLTLRLNAKTSRYFCINVRNFFAILGKVASVHHVTFAIHGGD